MLIYVIMDSSGRGLDKFVVIKVPPIVFLSYPDKGSVAACDAALCAIKGPMPRLIVSATGICDIIKKQYSVPKYRLRYDSPEDGSEYVCNQLTSAYDKISATFPYVPILVATIVGVDLQDYNNSAYRFMDEEARKVYLINKQVHPEQSMMNITITKINSFIISLNRRNDVPTPHVASTIHRYYDKKFRHMYRELRDGCHFNDKTKQKWVILLEKAITKLI